MRQKPTEHRIREFLVKNQVVTCQELADALSLTKSNIQYHLQKMVREKTLAVGKLKRDATKGRPVKTYHLHPSAKPNNYEMLCSATLAVLPMERNEGNAAFERVGEQIAQHARCSGSMTQRLTQLVRFLNQQGYQANWEAHRIGPLLTFRNCPYLAILKNQPSLCVVDRALISKAVEAGVTQLETLRQADDERLNACRFLIGSESSAGEV